MKRIILVLLFLPFFHAFSQNLALSWHDGPITHGSTIDVSGRIDTAVYVEIKVHNTGTSAIEVKLMKEDIYLVPGSIDTYCFAGQCVGGSTTISPSSVQIDPGLYDSSFIGDYYPMGIVGVSIIKYTFFDINSPDSISVTVRYSGELGIPSIAGPLPVLSNGYPNPATDRVSFEYASMHHNSRNILVIRDMSGRTIKETILPGVQGTIEMDLGGIENGVYFYSLVQNQQTFLTRKLVVRK